MAVSPAVSSNLQLEAHFHHRFADVRCSSDGFLYLADGIDHYADLESYCSDLGEAKAPLLILGETGVGKSALLANWTSRRRRSRRRNLLQGSASSTEFVFWHAVGSTRQSTKVETMLRRLMTELRGRFDLAREVPVRDDRLSWDFPRFLEQAAKRGSVILVLDGIHLLTSEGGGEIGMTWLPLSLPANVRVIVSVSSRVPLPETYSKHEIVTEEMLTPRRPRFINELNRRQWLLLRIRPLDLSFSRTLVMDYFRKTVQSEAADRAADPFLTSLPNHESIDSPSPDGLVLFPSQVEDIMRHPRVTSPLFLRTLLESLSWAAEHGFCVWSLLERWLAAADYSALVRLVLASFVEGFSCEQEAVDRARNKSLRAGGRQTLRVMYPWHPGLQTEGDVREMSLSRITAGDNDSSSSVSALHLTQNVSVLRSIENPVWVAAFELAEEQLLASFEEFKARVEAGPIIESFSQPTLRARRMSFSERVKEVVYERATSKLDRRPSIIGEPFEMIALQQMQGRATSLVDAGRAVRPPGLESRKSVRNFFTNVPAADAPDSLEGVPSYLVGGMAFEGLGSVLSYALALLFVSHCGLRESELWSMLVSLREREVSPSPDPQHRAREHRLIFNTHRKRGELEDVWRTMDQGRRGEVTRRQLVTGIRKVDPTMSDEDVEILVKLVRMDSAAPRVNYKDFLRFLAVEDRKLRVKENSNRIAPLQASEETDSFAGGNESLGPIAETSLLTALKSLGILRSAEFGTLVFPFDNALLRDVVFDSVIEPRGGIEFWHSVLVSHFLRLPNSLRRSEELPFHLESTRRWFALRDLLADLGTFEIMWSSELSKELVRYWRMLTQGPLYAKKPSDRERRVDADDEEGHRKQSSALLKNIELTSKLGLTETVSKRRLLVDKVAPFDVVEVYNKSVESWVEGNDPSSQEVFDKLAIVGSFLLRLCHEIAERNTDLFPPYMRLPVDSKALASLPLGIAGLKFAAFDGEASRGEREPGGLGDMYYLRRWVWVQFPWLALKYKSELVGETAGVKESTETVDRPQGRTASLAMVEAMGNIVDQSLTSKSTRSDHMRGFWELKRLDPNLTFDSYQNAVKRTKSPTKRSSPTVVAPQFSVMNFSVDSIKPVRRLRPLHRYRKSMKETLEGARRIKFASPSLRSLHHNTLFPSVARDLLERHIDVMRRENDPFHLAAACARAGDKSIPIDLDLFSEVQDIYAQDVTRYADYPMECSPEEETARVAQLRGIYDKAHFALQERRLQLSKLELEYSARQSLDAETTARLDSGEEAIASLERRHEAVVAATAEADKMNSGLRQLALICEQNPAHTKHHVSVVEHEVRLAKQQLRDLERFREGIYAEAAQTDLEGGRFIEGQAAYYEAMRRSTSARKERQLAQKRDLQLSMLRTGFPKEDIPGYRDFHDDEYVEEVARIRDAYLSDLRSEVKRAQPASPDPINEGQLLGLGPEANETDSFEDEIGDERFPSEERPPLRGEHILEEYHRTLAKSNSKSVEELCNRFLEGQSLFASLSNQSTMAESKVVLLRSELSKLTNYFIDITLTPGERTGKRFSEEATIEGVDSRALDDQLVQAQLKLNQVVRQTENAESLLDEIRTGVSTLMALLEANASLMASLVQKPAPPLQSNSDIGEALAWCEEKIIAVSEVLLYDTSKLAGKPSISKWQKLDVTNENQPLPARQVELALLMEGMLTKDPDDPLPRYAKSPHQRKLRKKLGLSRAGLQSKTSKPAELRSPRAVMVPAKSALDSEFENRVLTSQSRQDAIASQQMPDDSFLPAGQRRREALEVAQFVTGALASHSSVDLLRQQRNALKQLDKSRTVSKGSRGWAIDSLLRAKQIEPLIVEQKSGRGNNIASPKKAAPGGTPTSSRELDTLPSRTELKQHAHDFERSALHPSAKGSSKSGTQS